MRSEVIVPLGAYFALAFLLSLYAFHQRAQSNFLQKYFLGNRSMGGFVLAMTLTATYIDSSSFISSPGAAYQYGLGWVAVIDNSVAGGMVIPRCPGKEIPHPGPEL